MPEAEARARDRARRRARALARRLDLQAADPGGAAQRGKPVTTATALWMAERGGRHVIGVTGHQGQEHDRDGHRASAEPDHADRARGQHRPPGDRPARHGPVRTPGSCASSRATRSPTSPSAPRSPCSPTSIASTPTGTAARQQYRADKLRIFELPGVRAAVRPLGDRGGWPLVVRAGADPAARATQRRRTSPRPWRRSRRLGSPLPPLPEALEGLTALPHRLQTVHTDVRRRRVGRRQHLDHARVDDRGARGLR